MLRRLFLAVNLVLVSCWAQETAEITGRIVDASGSVTPGVNVEIRNVNTNAKWDVVTNGEGYYTQALLPPDDYRVMVRLAGFKQEARNVRLEVQQVSRLDFQVGGWGGERNHRSDGHDSHARKQ